MDVQTLRTLRRDGRHEEAQALAVTLAQASPHDAELQFEAACVHDFLGLEAQAVPYYRAALAGTLTAPQRRDALLGLGSTLRTLGRYAEARDTLLQGRHEFPDAPEMKAFLAMALYNTGDAKAAVELLLRTLLQTSDDADLQAFRRAIELYAEDLDRTWT